MSYGTSTVFPESTGEHTHHYCVDQDTATAVKQIGMMQRRGSQYVRDNNITGVVNFIGNTHAMRDEKLQHYCEVFLPLLMEHSMFGFPVVLDRNYTGNWTIAGNVYDGILNVTCVDNPGITMQAAIFARANSSYSAATRLTLAIAIFGDPANAVVQALRAWFLAEARELFDNCPQGTWFQFTNGPEITRVCGHFGTVVWDLTPASMHVGIVNANPAANRAWILNTLGISTPSTEAAYVTREAAFIELVRLELIAAGHPAERLIEGGIHPYVLDSGVRRSLGAPTPVGWGDMPGNAVFSEFGMARRPADGSGLAVKLDDPNLIPRDWTTHREEIYSFEPRTVCIHSYTDARRADLWTLSKTQPGATMLLWENPGYVNWLNADPTRRPDQFAAYHLLTDEPTNADQLKVLARRFGENRDGALRYW